MQRTYSCKWLNCEKRSYHTIVFSKEQQLRVLKRFQNENEKPEQRKTDKHYKSEKVNSSHVIPDEEPLFYSRYGA